LNDAVLLLNAGLSRLKFSLFADRRRPTHKGLQCEGQCLSLGHHPRLIAKDGLDVRLIDESMAPLPRCLTGEGVLATPSLHARPSTKRSNAQLM
jgi:hypothetical protein